MKEELPDEKRRREEESAHDARQDAGFAEGEIGAAGEEFNGGEEGEERADDGFDDGITGRDWLAAVAALAFEEEPAEDRDVVADGDAAAACRAGGRGPEKGHPFGQAVC